MKAEIQAEAEAEAEAKAEECHALGVLCVVHVLYCFIALWLNGFMVLWLKTG